MRDIVEKLHHCMRVIMRLISAFQKILGGVGALPKKVNRLLNLEKTTKKIKLKPLSPEATAARRPPPPEELVGAL
jgi:hypothetical protein